VNEFFSYPKFDEGCWNCHVIAVHSRAMSILPSGAKKNGKIVLDYFAVDFGHYFALIGKVDSTPPDVTASPCRTLMPLSMTCLLLNKV